MTRDFSGLVRRRIVSDPGFRDALLREGIDIMLSGDLDTAKAILIEGNPQAGIQAFMQGKIKVEGDIAKLMALQTVSPDPTAAEIAARIQAMTE